MQGCKSLYKLIVTVMLLLCTIRVGGHPRPSTSKSLKYATHAASSLCVPCTGLGSVVNITAVSLLFCLISSFSTRCCARQGRSLKDSGRDCVEYADPRCGIDGGDDRGESDLSADDAGAVPLLWSWGRYADGRRFRRDCDSGVSINMIEGPAPSSVAIWALGRVRELNFWLEAWRDKIGRSLALPRCVVFVGESGAMVGDSRSAEKRSSSFGGC